MAKYERFRKFSKNKVQKSNTTQKKVNTGKIKKI